MRIVEKMELAKAIAEELSAWYDAEEIDVFLSNFEVPEVEYEPFIDSDQSYANKRLRLAKSDELVEIADELYVDVFHFAPSYQFAQSQQESPASLPANISHSTKSPELFISYGWTDSEHEEWVRHLAQKLRASGVDAILDAWDLNIGHDTTAFMERIADPNTKKVLIVVDKNYAEKADAREGGVGIETQMIAKEVYKDKKQNKFAAIVLEKDENNKPYLPLYYGSRIYIDFSNPDNFEDEFKKLRLWCFDETLHKKPPLKEIIEPPSVKVSWTEREICRAAVKTYFSLKDMPVDFKDSDDFKGFKSAAGYIYYCKLEGNVAVLQWVNETDEAMNSRATSFELDGNTLVVTDNIWGTTQTFQA